MLHHSFSEEIVPNIQPWPKPGLFPLCFHLGEEAIAHLAALSCQGVTESEQVMEKALPLPMVASLPQINYTPKLLPMPP